VYASSSPNQVRYLIEDPEATVVVAENRELLDEVFAVVDDLEHELDAIVTFDDVDTTDLDAEIGTDSENLSTDDVYTLGEVHALGDEAFDEDAYQSWIDAVDVGDLASLIYTSGTTGQPKGVRLTHANFRENVSQCYRRFADRPDRDSDVPGISAESTTLSFSPRARLRADGGPLHDVRGGRDRRLRREPRHPSGGLRAGTPDDDHERPARLREAVRRDPRAGRRVSRERADLRVGSRRGKAHHEADEPGAVLNAKCAVADRLVFSSVREAIGGNIDFFISGGGSLSAELCALYHAMDLPILEGTG